MRKQQRLGQHFLISYNVANSIIDAAELSKKDTVFELGTGKGILVPLLCSKAKKVISVEADKNLYEAAKLRFSGIPNLVLKHGDGLKEKEKFSVFISNLPYSESRRAIEWLIQQKFSRAVIMVQREFAEKLICSSKKQRKAISVLAEYSLSFSKIKLVKKTNFEPPPKVDSIVLKLIPKKTVSKNLIETVNNIFSYRRKTLQNILKQFEMELPSDNRLDDMEGGEIVKIAQKITK